MRSIVVLASICLSSIILCSTPAFAADSLKDGIAQYQNKRYPEAIKLLNDRLTIAPKDPVALYYLGNSWLALGKLDYADRAYSECLANDPPLDISNYAFLSRREIYKRKIPAPNTRNSNKRARRNGPISEQQRLVQTVEDLKQTVRDRTQQDARNRIASLERQIQSLRRSGEFSYDSGDFVFSRRGMLPSSGNAGRIAYLQNQISQIRRQAMADIHRSEDEIEHTYEELSTSASATKGNIKPLITSRSLYVRDYVHFTGDEPVPEIFVAPMRVQTGKYVIPSSARPTTTTAPVAKP